MSHLSIAHITGFGAFIISLILVLLKPEYAIIPLVLFLLIAVMAPFMVRFSFFLPIISRGKSKKNAVAITFDDGPDPAFTPRLLELLSLHSIKAAFFVIGEKAEKYPEIIRKIIDQGHIIGNHSWSHDPFLMLRSSRTLKTEIEKTGDVLKKQGIVSRAFRPPVGITNPRLWKVLRDLGLQCVNFSCRAYDRGNKNIDRLGEKILRKVKQNDIVLLHDVNPENAERVSLLLREIDVLFSGLNERGIDVISLDDITGMQLMELIE